MEQQLLKQPFIPELGTPYRGKVREIYTQDERLTMIATDRISVFDCILNELIPDKGQILTKLSHFWFENTQDIVSSHLISHPDPNVLVVKKCHPVRIEVIVRGFLVGSLWADYAAGKRVKCGIALPDGLQRNDPLPNLILTPTTKSETGHDEDITEAKILEEGLATEKVWEEIKSKAFNLFRRGQELLSAKGVVLVDTKYEFGIDSKGQVTLIDEIHTPDSSRFWFSHDLARQEIKFPDKELLREWLRGKGFKGEGALPQLPKEIIDQVKQGYRKVYEMITGKVLAEESGSAPKRLIKNLKEAQIIKGVFTLIIAGSEVDRPHVEKIQACLDAHSVPHCAIYGSAHKQPKFVLDLIETYNNSIEPLVCITVAGRSNALSGVMAANLKWPVIASPPFKDASDYLVNIHSSLQMPSGVPAMTAIDPGNAALAAVRILKAMELCA